MVLKVKNIFYPVTNMKDTSEFYEEVLGLQLQFIDRDQWAQFKVSGVTFALGGAEETPSELESGAVVTFEVENLRETREVLQHKGLEVSEIRDMGSHGKTCYFFDPSNNIVQLFEK